MPRPKAGQTTGAPPRNSARRTTGAASASPAPERVRSRATPSASPSPRRVPSRLGAPDSGAADPGRSARASSLPERPSFYPEPEEFDGLVPPLLAPRRSSEPAEGRASARSGGAAWDEPPAPARLERPSSAGRRTARPDSPSSASSGAAAGSAPRREPKERAAQGRGGKDKDRAAAIARSAASSDAAPSGAGRGAARARREPRGLWFEVGGVLALALGAVLTWNAFQAEPQGWLPWHALRLLRTLLGIGAYVVPMLACVLGVLLITQRQGANLRAFWRGVTVSLLVLLAGVHLGVPLGQEFEPAFLTSRGGLAGAGVAWVLRRLLGGAGAGIVLAALSLVALLLLTEVSLSEIAARLALWLGRSSDAWRERAESFEGGVRARLAFLRAQDDEYEGEYESPSASQPEAARPRRRQAQVPAPAPRDFDLAHEDKEEDAGHSPFDARIAQRASAAPPERQPLFFDEEEIGGHHDAPSASAPSAAERAAQPQAQVLEDVAPAAEAPAPDRLSSVRLEIDLAPPPPSVLDAVAPADGALPTALPTPQVLGGAAEVARDASLVPINAPDDDLTPAEALEAQAQLSSREEAPAPRRRPAGIRRTFGDGPPMPEYFDAAVRSLDPPVVPDLAGVEEDIRESITTVEETLLSFKVDARVTDVKRGPVITRYEVEPASGVRVNAIANLDRDLARALAAHAVRIEAPVPGKNVVGIEIPNKKVHLVRLRDVLELPEFLSAPSKLSFVLGKDIAGQPKWADLTKMPHMLVAGATNSGKSVCLNAIIASIIARASPDEVKFSLIDPKRVELTLYRDIPHLYHPVVVEPKDAVKVLRGMIVEMDRRYKKFAEAGVRNIVSYNQKLDPDEMQLPYIVVVIDELADLMMTAAAEFEKLICRLAQLARATGIHLIVATQRPSVNVITGVIKANIPARVAFAVASQVDSRTILDAVGAERLIGSGDMLFDANNGGKAVRIQGAYLSEEEVNRIVQVAKGAYRDEPREYGMDLNQFDETTDNDDKPASTSRAMPDDRRDDMYDEVREFILRHQEVSASMIQRKYEIGFPRAARIVDQFERDGLLGPADGPKPRKVLSSGV